MQVRAPQAVRGLLSTDAQDGPRGLRGAQHADAGVTPTLPSVRPSLGSPRVLILVPEADVGQNALPSTLLLHTPLSSDGLFVETEPCRKGPSRHSGAAPWTRAPRLPLCSVLVTWLTVPWELTVLQPSACQDERISDGAPNVATGRAPQPYRYLT